MRERASSSSICVCVCVGGGSDVYKQTIVHAGRVFLCQVARQDAGEPTSKSPSRLMCPPCCYCFCFCFWCCCLCPARHPLDVSPLLLLVLVLLLLYAPCVDHSLTRFTCPARTFCWACTILPACSCTALTTCGWQWPVEVAPMPVGGGVHTRCVFENIAWHT